ncbi:MAG: Tetratricopeptide repeat [Pyrinomonadaceae bacterium]|jgi:tetratricopeptide (TPR) repeat protein|nr:Tetratricopeptide repeat [Pyrinomonadaceae bacterium]
MTKTCPSCDVLAPPDARYCRHCGAPLKRLGAAGDTGGNVSPIAATVPLSDQNTTDEIVAPHPATATTHTSEVSHEEMYDLWRRGTPTGEVGDNDAGNSGDGQQFASTRDGRGVHHASHAHQAGTLPADSPQNYAPGGGDIDPEQTQITINVRPLTSRLPPDTDANTFAATRANNKPQFNSMPQQVTLSPTGSLQTPTPTPAVVTRPAAQPNERRAFRVWLGMGLALLSIVVIGCVAVAVWFGARGLRRASETPPPAVAEAATPAADPKQLVQAKLVEADTLIASGNTTEALARLREAAVLDPADAEPHRRLARLLLANGSRREAVEELRVTTRLAPGDAESWRSLASAQFAEGLYDDALESYRGLGEASPAALARDSVQLAYADALRLAGRTNDARVIYRRLAETSTDAQVAAASKRQLGQPTPSPTDEAADEAAAQTADAARANAATAARNGDAAGNRTPDTSSASPTPQPTTTTARAENSSSATASATPLRASSGSPSDQYQRGVALWATNRAAAVAEFRAASERGNSDASYYLGLSIAEGRDPRALKRAELVAAIVYFGRARRGRFRAQSVTYEEQLGRELDRRRSQ